MPQLCGHRLADDRPACGRRRGRAPRSRRWPAASRTPGSGRGARRRWRAGRPAPSRPRRGRRRQGGRRRAAGSAAWAVQLPVGGDHPACRGRRCPMCPTSSMPGLRRDDAAGAVLLLAERADRGAGQPDEGRDLGSVAASASTAAPPAEWPTAPTSLVSTWPWNGLDVAAFSGAMRVIVASRSCDVGRLLGGARRAAEDLGQVSAVVIGRGHDEAPRGEASGEEGRLVAEAGVAVAEHDEGVAAGGDGDSPHPAARIGHGETCGDQLLQSRRAARSPRRRCQRACPATLVLVAGYQTSTGAPSVGSVSVVSPDAERAGRREAGWARDGRPRARCPRSRSRCPERTPAAGRSEEQLASTRAGRARNATTRVRARQDRPLRRAPLQRRPRTESGDAGGSITIAGQ